MNAVCWRILQASGSEALAILSGNDESFNHLGIDEVAAELVELVEPEVVTVEV